MIRTVSPCGGGYGLERDPRRPLEDVLDEFISVQSAHALYGAVVDLETGRVHQETTANLRANVSGGIAV